MILTEDGSGIRGATSFTTVGFFRSYHGARGLANINDLVAYPDVLIEQVLVKATDYIETRWGRHFLGRKQFPRLYARSVLDLSDNAVEGETVTVGSVTFTFRAVPTGELDVEIRPRGDQTARRLAQRLWAVPNENFFQVLMLGDLDAEVVVYTNEAGVSTTDTLSSGGFDRPVTSGDSVYPQPLSFPRLGLHDRDGQPVVGIPLNVQKATAEYALRAISGPLQPDPVTSETGLLATKVREKVGPIETETMLAANFGVQIDKPYPAADRLLQEYTSRHTGVIRS